MSLNLSDLRDYNTDDGEPYWKVTPFYALDALHGEMLSWPDARVLNPSTGEIFEAPLRHLLPAVVEGLRAGHKLRIEPAPTPQQEVQK